MNAIIRHLSSGEHFLASLDASGDVTGVSAPLPITDVLGRDRDIRDLTGDEWEENFGFADVEPLGDDAKPSDWTADRIAVVHEI
jgi:hypothetical protein